MSEYGITFDAAQPNLTVDINVPVTGDVVKRANEAADRADAAADRADAAAERAPLPLVLTEETSPALI